MAEEKTRHYVKFKTSNIPVDASQRQGRLTDDFYKYINRQLDNTDYIHVPGLIDSPENVSAWIVFDIDVGTRGQDVTKIPLKCWRVQYKDKEPQFSPCQAGLQAYNHILEWGGTNRSMDEYRKLDEGAVVVRRC